MMATANRWSERWPGLALLLARLYVARWFLGTGYIKLLVILIGGAGQFWGLDGWWRRRRRP